MARLTASIAVVALLNAALAFADVEVLFSPKSLILQNASQPLLSSDYSKFVSLSLAYSTDKPRDWDGFYGYKNFASIPRSVITFHVPLSLETIASQVYQLNDNSDVENQFSAISHSMLSRFKDSFSERVQLYKNSADDLQTQVDSLNSYLSQLKELKSKSQLPQRVALWFDFTSAPKADTMSVNQFRLQMQEAVKGFRGLLDDSVLVVSVVNEDLQPLKRISRQAADEKPNRNLAYEYDAEFHTAFATIGFTTVLLLIAVFAVSISMWNIDPGRDSIIYRLTSQRIKKDQ